MKNKILMGIVVLILVVIAGFAVFSSKQKEKDPKTIVKEVTELKEYKVDITYTTKNSRGEFSENAGITHTENDGTKLTLQDKEQIFTEEKIKINYFEGDKTYTVDRSYDEFYRFFLINELPQYLNNNDVEYKVGSEKEKNHIVVNFKTDSKNQNFYRVEFIVDAKEKAPESLVIYDINDKERVIVNYKNFIAGAKKK